MCQAATPGDGQLKRERTLRDTPDADTDAKETLRGFYAIADPADAEVFLDELITEFGDAAHPIEVRSLGRTLGRWRDQILAWHQSV